MGGASTKTKTKTHRPRGRSRDTRVLRVPYQSASYGRVYRYKTGDGFLNVTPYKGATNKFQSHSAPRLRRQHSDDSFQGVIIYSPSESGIKYGSYSSLHRVPSIGRLTAFQAFDPPTRNQQNNRHHDQQHQSRNHQTQSRNHQTQSRQHQNQSRQHQKQSRYQQHQSSHSQAEKRSRHRDNDSESRIVYPLNTGPRAVSHTRNQRKVSTSSSYPNGSVRDVLDGRTVVKEVHHSNRHATVETARPTDIGVTSGRKSRNTINTLHTPTVSPPTSMKRDLITDTGVFEDIDAYVMKCPGAACSSVRLLANYLSRPATTDLHRVRAIYTWIAHNIRYDIRTNQSTNSKSTPSDPLSVLINRKSSSEGFAYLTAALCREMDILVKTVRGFSKHMLFDPEKTFEDSKDVNHTWNLVFVYGDWHPMDCTWASGYIDDYNHFQLSFSEFYFLTDPHQFIWNHFPFNPDDLQSSLRDQLLREPVQLSSFNKRACPNRAGLEWGLELISHKDNIIQVNRSVKIEFHVHNVQLTNVVCKLKDAGTGELCSRYTLTRRKGDGPLSVLISPPSAAKYILHIYGDPVGENKFFLCSMVNYTLRCTSAIPDVPPYPEHKGIWGVKPEAVDYGFAQDIHKEDQFLTESGTLEFRIGLHRSVTTMLKLQHAVFNIPNLNDYTICEYSRGSIKVKVRLPEPGYYKMSLYAKPPNSEGNTVDLVAAYLIQNTVALTNCEPFPKTFPFTQASRSRLLEPLSGWIPSNKIVEFRIQSPDLQRVLVDGAGKPAATNGVFVGAIEARKAGQSVSIYGNLDGGIDHDELYRFFVVDTRPGVIV